MNTRVRRASCSNCGEAGHYAPTCGQTPRTRWFQRVIADTVTEAVDQSRGRAVLHTRAGGEVVGAYEVSR